MNIKRVLNTRLLINWNRFKCIREFQQRGPRHTDRQTDRDKQPFMEISGQREGAAPRLIYYDYMMMS